MVKLKHNTKMAIVKSNNLIETSYRLGSREQFFVLFLISKIDSIHDLELQSFQIHYQDIARILNFDGKRRVANRNDIFKIMDNLNKERIRFENDEIEGQAVWISSMERNKKTDVFTISIDPKLKPYLIQLKEQFTKYNIQNIVNLNSHAIRMYEILKRYEYQGSVILNIQDQLKDWLGVANKYKEYYEFKRWVIVDSQRQLKKYTDIAFTFEPYQKLGRKIISLKFTIEKNEPSHIPKALGSLESIPSKKILPEQSNNMASKANIKNSTKHNDAINQLSWTQKKVYDFLTEKGINKVFTIEKIICHSNLFYDPIVGFEDIYIKLVWHFYKKKTTSKNLAPTFVTWWKKNRLTSSAMHARFLDDLITHKKQLPHFEKTNRESFKGMTEKVFLEGQKNTHQENKIDFTKIDISFNKKAKHNFDISIFKAKNAEIYTTIFNTVKAEFEQKCKDAGIAFDYNKFQKSILDNTASKCKEWLKSSE